MKARSSSGAHNLSIDTVLDLAQDHIHVALATGQIPITQRQTEDNHEIDMASEERVPREWDTYFLGTVDEVAGINDAPLLPASVTIAVTAVTFNDRLERMLQEGRSYWINLLCPTRQELSRALRWEEVHPASRLFYSMPPTSHAPFLDQLLPAELKEAGSAALLKKQLIKIAHYGHIDPFAAFLKTLKEEATFQRISSISSEFHGSTPPDNENAHLDFLSSGLARSPEFVQSCRRDYTPKEGAISAYVVMTLQITSQHLFYNPEPNLEEDVLLQTVTFKPLLLPPLNRMRISRMACLFGVLDGKPFLFNCRKVTERECTAVDVANCALAMEKLDTGLPRLIFLSGCVPKNLILWIRGSREFETLVPNVCFVYQLLLSSGRPYRFCLREGTDGFEHYNPPHSKQDWRDIDREEIRELKALRYAGRIDDFISQSESVLEFASNERASPRSLLQAVPKPSLSYDAILEAVRQFQNLPKWKKLVTKAKRKTAAYELARTRTSKQKVNLRTEPPQPTNGMKLIIDTDELAKFVSANLQHIAEHEPQRKTYSMTLYHIILDSAKSISYKHRTGTVLNTNSLPKLLSRCFVEDSVCLQQRPRYLWPNPSCPGKNVYRTAACVTEVMSSVELDETLTRRRVRNVFRVLCPSSSAEEANRILNTLRSGRNDVRPCDLDELRKRFLIAARHHEEIVIPEIDRLIFKEEKTQASPKGEKEAKETNKPSTRGKKAKHETRLPQEDTSIIPLPTKDSWSLLEQVRVPIPDTEDSWSYAFYPERCGYSATCCQEKLKQLKRDIIEAKRKAGRNKSASQFARLIKELDEHIKNLDDPKPDVTWVETDIVWQRKRKRLIYVLDEANSLCAAPESDVKKHTRPTHSQLAQGRSIHAGGELVFALQPSDWQLVEINNGSGHYRPDTQALRLVASRLREIGIDTSHVKLRNVREIGAPLLSGMPELLEVDEKEKERK